MFQRQRRRPGHRQPFHRILLELRVRDFMTFLRLDQVTRETMLHILCEHRLHLFDQRRAVTVLRERAHRVSQARSRQRTQRKFYRHRLPRRHQRVQVPAMARQHVAQHLRRCIVGTVRARQPKRDHRQPIR